MRGPNPRLAIRPYPNQWEAAVETSLPVLIRPIRPADEPLLAAFQAKLSPEDIRFRFLAPRKEFSHKTTPASPRSTMPAPWPSSP
jgi:acetyltransferase